MMLEVLYPITGEYRPVLLLLEWCFATICGEMGIMFCVKYFKIRQKRNVQDLGYSALCSGLSVGWFFQITSDYYLLESNKLTIGFWNEILLGDLIWNIGFIGVMVGGLLFILVIERHIIFFRKYLFSKIYIACAGIFSVLFVINVIMSRMFAVIISFLILVCLLVLIWDLANKARNLPKYKRVKVRFSVIIATFGTGVLLTVDFGIINSNPELRLLGICLLQASFVSLCISLLLFPAVALLDWKKSLEELFLISKAGICLVQKSFGSHPRVLDESIATSAITTVNMLIQEMVASGEQGLSKVKKKNTVIFIYSSSLVTGAVISNEDNPAIPPKLKMLIRQFEEIYGHIVQNWNGDGSVFRPVETIIEEIFSA